MSEVMMSHTQISSFHDIIGEEQREEILQQESEKTGLPLRVRMMGLLVIGYFVYMTWAEPMISCAG